MRIQIVLTLLSATSFSPAFAADTKGDVPVPPLMVAELDENAAQCSIQMMQNGLIHRLNTDIDFQKAVEKKFNVSALILPGAVVAAGMGSVAKGLILFRKDEPYEMTGSLLASSGAYVFSVGAASAKDALKKDDNTEWTISNDKLNAAAESLAKKFGDILYLNFERQHVLKSLLVKEMVKRIKAKDKSPLNMFQFMADAKLRDDDYLLSEKQRNALTQFVAGKFPGEESSESDHPLTNKEKIQFLATCKATLEVYGEEEKANPDIRQVAKTNQRFLEKLSKQIKLEVSIHHNDEEQPLTGDDGVPTATPGDKVITDVK